MRSSMSRVALRSSSLSAERENDEAPVQPIGIKWRLSALRGVGQWSLNA
jgi:hypothetical protein